MKLDETIAKILLLLLIILLLVIFFVSGEMYQSKEFSLSILLINLLALIIFIRQKKDYIPDIDKQYIRIVTIFIFGYIIVFFQLHLDYILGNFDESNSRFWVNPYIVPKSLVISSIGFISFLYGYTYKKSKKNKFRKKYIYKFKTSLIGYNILALFFLSIMIVTINPLYIYGGYGNFEMGSTSRYCSILFELTLTAGVVQNVINLSFYKYKKISFIYYLKSIGAFQLVLLLFYLTIVIISGDRGPVIYLTLGVLSGYIVLTRWKVSKSSIIFISIFGSFLISGLVVIRNNDNKNTPLYIQVYKAVTEGKTKAYGALEGVNSVSNSTLELATSIRTLHNSVNTIPSKAPFFMGQMQFLQLITVIPFGQLVVKEFFDLKDYELTSAKYSTYIIGGENGTEGTSCIADIYIDFGMFGVLLGMLFFGIFVRVSEEEVFANKSPKLILLITYLVLCQYAIYIPRSTILFNFRNVIWVFLIMKFIQSISKKRFSI